MIEWANVSKEKKITVYNQVSAKTGLSPFAVEKDWWVVQSLSLVFDTEAAPFLVFKGGTSLSKAWGLIERFSEDVDLAIDRTFFGFKGDLSKSQRTRLRKIAGEYLTNTFLPELQKKFEKQGFTEIKIYAVEPRSSDEDPRIINIHYPNVFKPQGNIQPKIQLEIGVRSMREPFALRRFYSLLDEYYPRASFARKKIEIPAVNPERTFLEKIFLLHEEFQRPAEKRRVNGLSRHLYDIYQLSKKGIADRAINNKNLYESIVRHRFVFTKIGGINYNYHNPATINPLPPSELMSSWKKDYKILKENMIYGDSPDFDNMINLINEVIVNKFHKTKWKFDLKFPDTTAL